MSMSQKETHTNRRNTQKPHGDAKRNPGADKPHGGANKKPEVDERNVGRPHATKSPLKVYFDRTVDYKIKALKDALQLPSDLGNNDLGSVVVMTPLNRFVLAATGCRILSDNSFWRALFGEVSPVLQRALSTVRVTERMKEYYREHNPCSCSKTKDGALVYRYHFWEHMYAECQVLLADAECCVAVTFLVNNERYSMDDELLAAMKKILAFPFVSLFLAVKFSKFRSFVVHNNSTIYNYLESWPDNRDWEFSRGSYVVMKRILEEGEVTLEVKRVTLERVVLYGTLESLVLLLSDQELARREAPNLTNLLYRIRSEDKILYLLENSFAECALGGYRLLYAAVVNHWVALVSWVLPRYERLNDWLCVLFTKALAVGTEPIVQMLAERMTPEMYTQTHVMSLLARPFPKTLRTLLGVAAGVTRAISLPCLIGAYNDGFVEQVLVLLESPALYNNTKLDMCRWARRGEHKDVINVLRTPRDSDVLWSNCVPVIVAWLENRVADCESMLGRFDSARQLDFVCSFAMNYKDLAVFILTKWVRDGGCDFSLISERAITVRERAEGQTGDYVYPLLKDEFLVIFDAGTLNLILKRFLEGHVQFSRVERLAKALLARGGLDNRVIESIITNDKLVRLNAVSFLGALLRCKGFDPSYEDSRILDILCKTDTPELLEAVLADSRVNPGAYESSALFLAAKHNMKGLARKLLADPRVHPEDVDGASLQMACRFGDAGLVQLFLGDGRADPTTKSSLTLINAVYARKPDTVALLVADKRYCDGEETTGDCGCSNICPRARNELARKIAMYNGDKSITALIGRPTGV